MFGEKWSRASLIGLLCLTLGGGVYAAVILPQTAESSASHAADGGDDGAAGIGTVDINTADAETLARMLQGVGMVKAQDIVAYRETYGDFKSVEELLEVKGIGPATLERNRHRIVVSGADD